jgi:uncharacterized membrane protein YbhN (UPF0104 family)
VCLWQLDRIGLATRAWFPIATAQLSGTAVGRFVPGAPTPFTVELLHKAGIDTGKAAAALTTSTALQLATTAALPLLANRDFIRTTLGGRWKPAVVAAVANIGFDYLALLCALRAVGATPRPSLVVLAYSSAGLLALVPFTPGGLGFVEAGLVGTLTLAGVPAAQALTATLLYRLAAYWLPIPAGGVAYLLFRRRYP